ncbi:MAG TPA: rhomboid family intramembrane serine protease [Candidatus Polarisedimenticolaceae bacterium]|nr:rhomboid family intramembrane serine protease [Candidatus Polarisedimenticolaceae bacterium]
MSYYRSAPPPRGFGGGGLALPPFTPVIRGIVVACAGVYLLEIATYLGSGRSAWFMELFGLSSWGVLHRLFLWQPLTYMWLHALDPMHVVFNMLSLWLLGGELERQWGARRFLVYYLVCGVGAAPFIVAADMIPGAHASTVGASGAIFGIIVAFGVVFAERVIYLMALFPIKARTFAWIMFAVAFLSMLTQTQAGVSSIAHLGGMLVGWLYLKRIWRLPDMYRELRWRLRRRRFRVMDSRGDDNRYLH